MLFSTKLGQEIRPMAELNYKRIEALPTDNKEGLGGGGGGWREKLFPQSCNRSDGESKREKTRKCMLFYTNNPLGGWKWLALEREVTLTPVGLPIMQVTLCLDVFFFGHLEVHDYRIYYVNIDLRHHYGVSVAEAQTSLPSGKERGETAVFAGWDILRKKRV